MKRTSKILAAILSTVMLLTAALSVPVSAETNTLEYSFDYEKATEYAEKYMSDYFNDNFIDMSDFLSYDIAKPFNYEYNQYVVFPARCNLEMPMILNKRIGGYIFEGNNYYLPSDLGYIAVNYVTGDVLPLEDALEQGKIDSDNFYEFYREHEKGCSWDFIMCLIGDCDYDNCLTVKDATEIQKSIVFEYRVNDPRLIGDDVSDFNHDGDTNVMDATDIQKKIVQLI